MPIEKTILKKETVVLIVEDEKNTREILSRQLSHFYSVVFEAEDGIKAKEIIKSNKIDVVVTDIKMPKCCGNDLIRWMIERNQTFIPTVVTSAEHDVSVKLLDLNCIEIEDKPCDIFSLINKINGLALLDTKECSTKKALESVIKAKEVASGLVSFMKENKPNWEIN